MVNIDKNNKERKRQEGCTWDRSEYSEYNSILGYYEVQSIFENAHGKSLLDIGCGDGTLTAQLAKKFKRVVGIEASKKQIQKARKNCSKVELHQSLIENFRTKERFDVITMLNILEHVIDPVFTLKKAASFLNKKGILIVHIPNAMAVNRVIARIMGTLAYEYEMSPYDINIAGHRRSYDRKLLLKDIKRAGLKIVKIGGIFYKILSTPQMNWFLKNGLWDSGHGWGRVERKGKKIINIKKDWKYEFCRACYEFGKTRPDDCNIIYACIKK